MKSLATLVLATAAIAMTGCSNMTQSEQSVLSGSALGAVGGAALGSLSGRAGEGALIGAGIGAMGGAMADSNNRQNRARPVARERYYEEEECFADYCEITRYYY